MFNFNKIFHTFILCLLFCLVMRPSAQSQAPDFKAIAFFTAKQDLAHISFVHEANRWFPEMAKKYHFQYYSTNDWNNLNAEFLSHYQVVIFLDTRPDDTDQRKAFRTYMENGGAWMGFHFSAFALTPSDVPMNWDWYHNQFLGSFLCQQHMASHFCYIARGRCTPSRYQKFA